MKKHSIKKIEDAEFDLDQMKKEFLRSRGWKDSCSYPGALILWQHEEDGLKGCDLSTAFSLASYKELS